MGRIACNCCVFRRISRSRGNRRGGGNVELAVGGEGNILMAEPVTCSQSGILAALQEAWTALPS